MLVALRLFRVASYLDRLQFKFLYLKCYSYLPCCFQMISFKNRHKFEILKVFLGVENLNANATELNSGIYRMYSFKEK